MRRRLYVLAGLLIFLLVLWLPAHLLPARGHTWLELKDAETGREIASHALREGEEVLLTWKNSLFGLMVREVFVAREGRLDLTEVMFSDPRGLEPPSVTPGDLEDLYHTGGPFRAAGLSKPVTRLVFRIGEIGDPKLQVGEDLIQLAREVSFGGRVLLVARKPGLWGDGGLRELRVCLQDRIPSF